MYNTLTHTRRIELAWLVCACRLKARTITRGDKVGGMVSADAQHGKDHAVIPVSIHD